MGWDVGMAWALGIGMGRETIWQDTRKGESESKWAKRRVHVINNVSEGKKHARTLYHLRILPIVMSPFNCPRISRSTFGDRSEM